MSSNTIFTLPSEYDTPSEKGIGDLCQYVAFPKTVHRTLKDDRVLKAFPSTFVKSHQPNPPSRSWPP